jgi:hypothetical protein
MARSRFIERVEGNMTACYAIEKDSIGWVIWAGGNAVLTCREKRMAVNTARYAGALLVLQGEIAAHAGGLEASVHFTQRPGVRDGGDVGGSPLDQSRIVQ